jgi:hypothetical protein
MTVRARVACTSIALIAVGLLATAVVAWASGSATASNRQAAIRDSAQLLAGVTPPAGAVVRSKRSAIGSQRRVPLITSAPDSALGSERWNVPGEPATVLAYVESHLPPGSKVSSTGSGGPDPGFQSVIRSWAPVSGVLDTRWLEIEVSSRSGGGTDLFAESQSQWVVTRPANERVPTRVRQIEISEGLPGKTPQLSRTVTSAGKVRKLVALFNSLPIAQSGAINCPAETTAGAVITVTFRGSATGRALAVATVSPQSDLSWPVSVPGWSCFSTGFSVGGHSSDPLVGNVIRPMDQLLNVRLQRR